jgi:hypothetical protein
MSETPAQPAVTLPPKVEEVKNKIGNLFSSMSPIVIIGSVIAIFVILGVAYLIYGQLTRISTKGNKGILLEESKTPVLGTVITRMDGSVIPLAGNGQRMALSFWIYLNDIDKFNGTYRHVLHRGDPALPGASPLVFLDKDTNKLHIRFDKSPTLSSTDMSRPYNTDTEFTNTTTYPELDGKITVGATPTDLIKPTDKLTLDMMKHGITIDYIPLKRWVHVATVVNDQADKGVISAYVDGELVKSVDSRMTQKFVDTANNTYNVRFDFTNINLDKAGNIYVGGSSADMKLGPGFDGALSKIQVFNYDMNAKDVYDIYLQGPIDNPLNKVGLAAYGLRNPLYKLG